jgi:hypothetical protein
MSSGLTLSQIGWATTDPRRESCHAAAAFAIHIADASTVPLHFASFRWPP